MSYVTNLLSMNHHFTTGVLEKCQRGMLWFSVIIGTTASTLIFGDFSQRKTSLAEHGLDIGHHHGSEPSFLIKKKRLVLLYIPLRKRHRMSSASAPLRENHVVAYVTCVDGGVRNSRNCWTSRGNGHPFCGIG